MWRNILLGGVAFALGNGFAVSPDGQVSPMISNNLAITPGGHVEYVMPRASTGANTPRHNMRYTDDQGDE